MLLKISAFLKLALPFLIFLIGATVALAESLPSAFDLRDIDGRSYIVPVQNQGACGSCYSFGALAAAETSWNRAHNRHGERSVNLSEAFIVWGLSPLYEGFDKCNGSSYDYEELTGLVEHGVPREEDFPYTTDDPGDDLHWDAPRYSFEGWYRIPPNDVETTKRILKNIGAIDAAVYVDESFFDYENGIHQDSDGNFDVINDIIPYYSRTNHAIGLVGWEDNPKDGGAGYWILRNSWGESWGESGYMRIRYNAAAVGLEGTYIMADDWDGKSLYRVNDGLLTAQPWSAGGTLNAHGADLWGGAASRFDNTGTIDAVADAPDQLATARGIYLWGGPGGRVVNEGRIDSSAVSRRNHGIAYGICIQGEQAENHGTIHARASSEQHMALAFGIWGANGGDAVDVINSGAITATAAQGTPQGAYGIWADSRRQTKVTNSGHIRAVADDYAVGVLLTGGPTCLVNTGTIQGVSDTGSSNAAGVVSVGPGTIVNSGTIEGSSASLYLLNDRHRVWLTEDSVLQGAVRMAGDDNLVTNFGTINGEIRSQAASSVFDNSGTVVGNIGMGAGTLYLRGGASVDGKVDNSGVLNLDGAFGVSTIDGDYLQRAGAVMGVAMGNGRSDRLDVSGRAEIQGGRLRIIPVGVIRDGETHQVLKAGTITGAFDEYGLPSVVLSFSELYTRDVLTLKAQRKSYADALAGLQFDPNRFAISHNLMQIIEAGPEDGMASAINVLDGKSTTVALAQAMDQMSPEAHTVGAAMGKRVSLGFIGEVQDRLAFLRSDFSFLPDAWSLPAGATEEEDGAWSPWTRVDHTRVNQADSDGFGGYRCDATIIYLGMDRAVNERLSLGASLGVARSVAETDGQWAEIDADWLQGGFYGSWNEKDYFIDAALMFASGEYASLRRLPAFGADARGNHRGRDCSFYLGGGCNWSVRDWHLTPVASLQLGDHREKAFKERGAGALNLDVDRSSRQFLMGKAGFRLSRLFKMQKDMALLPEFSLQWGHEFGDRAPQTVARFSGGGLPMTISGIREDRDSVLAGVKLNAKIGDRVSLVGAYEGDFRSDFDAHRFQAGLSFSF